MLFKVLHGSKAMEISEISKSESRKLSASPLISTESKQNWPELVGNAGEMAKAVIEIERPDLTDIYILPDTAIITMDYNTRRVRIFVDMSGLVSLPPRLG